jgi:hypothetical protein
MDDAIGIAFTAHLPFRGLRGFAIDPSLLAGFPPDWLAERQVVPLSFSDGVLTLASATPAPDLTGLTREVEVKVVISPAEEIARALGASAPPPPAEPPRPAPPPAREEPPRPAAPPARAEPPREPPPLPTPDRAALALLPEHLQRRHRCLPLRVEDDALVVAVADEPGEDLATAAAPRAVRVVRADGRQVDDALLAVHGARWTAAIERGLPRHGKPDAPAREDAAPPTTTLLMALDGGVGAAVQAATTLAALDHPPERLEVILLVSGDDAPGVRAARTTPHRVLAGPRDRRARLDLGLLLARGEHVAVLDPGDIPAPHLLRHADAALARAGVAAARAQPAHPVPAPAPSRRRLALHRAPPTPLPRSGLVVRRAVLDALGGFADLAARLHAARLQVATLGDAVATAERS